MFDLINVAQAGVISDAPTFQSIGLKVINFLLSLVSVVAIIMLVVSGMMYFFAFGNEKKMADAKKAAKFSIIGIVIIFSTMIIMRLVGKFFS